MKKVITMEKTKEILDKIEQNKSQFKGEIVYDGIVNLENYLASPIKILWILKEVNSSDSDWDLRDALSDLKNENRGGLKTGWANTFTPIVYTTYGILENVSWSNMGNYYENQEMIDVLKNIAYINIKKVPGTSVSNWQEIRDYYIENKQAIHNQIKLINPDVIIFGNTLEFFDEDFYELFDKFEENKENNSLHIYSNENNLLLYAYHPNNRKISQKEYCDLIIDSVSNWKKKFNK